MYMGLGVICMMNFAKFKPTKIATDHRKLNYKTYYVPFSELQMKWGL